MIKFDFHPKTSPFPHQTDAIEFIKRKKNVALFDEQGLGKSKVIIDSICSNIRDGLINGALIVCKKNLIRMWGKEIETHSNLRYTDLTGSKYQRRRLFLTFSHFYVINYESFIQEKDIISKLLSTKKFALVLDESHKIKNPKSKTCKAILSVKDLAAKRIIVTGTPVANKPEDLWSQFYFLDNGEALGSSFEEFKKDHGIEIKGGRSFINEFKLRELKEKINDISIRRTKDQVSLELPKKIYQDIFVALYGKQKSMYDQLKKELCLEITDMDGDTVIEEANNILKKLLRLTQIASNPYLIDKSYNEEPAKFIRLDELLEKLMAINEKVIVWSSFVENINILYNKYREIKSLRLHGEIPIHERNKIVEWFQTDPDYRVLVANPAAAREGLTLTAANNAIYVDRSFNLVDYVQSQDRIHRISQKKKCKVIKLVAKKTIDEYIEFIMHKKHQVAKYVQGDIEKISWRDMYLSRDEIIEMLG